jgi:acid phosphatase family membrane protein YuiD
MLEELGRNQTLICCLVAWFSAQLIKYLIQLPDQGLKWTFFLPEYETAPP